MPDAAALLARLDAIAALVAELRAEVAARGASGAGAAEKSAHNTGLGADDLSDGDLIEVSQAVQVFNRPPDSLRWMCRTQDCGRKIGGRWMVSPARVRRWLNGGG